MRKIGYARVSTPNQNLDRQLGALRAERCDVIYREKASGRAIRNRPELEKAVDELGTGDVLVVAEWDRATRSMFDGISLIDRIAKRGALIKVLDKPHLDLTTAIGRGFIAFLSAWPRTSGIASSPAPTLDGRLQEPRASSLAASRRSTSTSRRRLAADSMPVTVPEQSPGTSTCITQPCCGS